MVGHHEQRRRIGKGLVSGIPSRVGVAVRRYDREIADLDVKGSGKVAGCRIGGKQAVFVDQRHFQASNGFAIKGSWRARFPLPGRGEADSAKPSG
jgi:hypothetical protein